MDDRSRQYSHEGEDFFRMTNEEIIKAVKPQTITDDNRVEATIEAVRKVVREEIQGDIIECGVYKGGQVMAMLYALMDEKELSRDVYLYDTFEGMPEPEEVEGQKTNNFYNNRESLSFCRKHLDEEGNWCKASTNYVLDNVMETGYPRERIHFVKGKVEDTLPENTHRKISVLRLDTDWYVSTKIELELLYPKLEVGGVLLIDDYDTWDGCRKAVNEYFSLKPVELKRSGRKGRIVTKE